jgi:hypothetical protein
LSVDEAVGEYHSAPVGDDSPLLEERALGVWATGILGRAGDEDEIHGLVVATNAAEYGDSVGQVQYTLRRSVGSLELS